jgi:hypothetical protein
MNTSKCIFLELPVYECEQCNRGIGSLNYVFYRLVVLLSTYNR